MTDYASTTELRQYVRLPVLAGDETDPDDVFLSLALSASRTAINRACNRSFDVPADEGEPTERLYTPSWDADRLRYVIDIDDLMDSTGLVVTMSGTATTDFTLLPANVAANDRPWTVIVLGSGVMAYTTEGSASVVALWGWSAVPDTIKNATLLQSARLVKRRDAPFGVAGSPEMGSELRLLARLDPDVEVMVGDYRRWWGAV